MRNKRGIESNQFLRDYFQRVLAITIMSVCPSVCLFVFPYVRHTGGSVKKGAS